MQNDTQQPVTKHLFEKEIQDIEFQALSGKNNGISQLPKSLDVTRKRSIDQISQDNHLNGFEYDLHPDDFGKK